MHRLTADTGALGEAIVFLGYFEGFPDPRQRGKVVYPFDEILLLCLLAVLAGAETFVDIARFGEKKIDLLRRFRPFRDGTPSHDHLGDIFASLDAEEFQRRFVAWVAAQTGTSAEVIAIDGKTLRRSYQKKGAKAPIHMVSAFAARARLVLGQVKVADKSNEIVAIPALLDMMAIEGAIVTIDAIGCQRNIAEKIDRRQQARAQRRLERGAAADRDGRSDDDGLRAAADGVLRARAVGAQCLGQPQAHRSRRTTGAAGGPGDALGRCLDESDCLPSRCPADSTTPGVENAWGGPKRSPPRLIYCTVLARSAKLPTPPWPPAMRSIWMPIFWTPFTSAVVPGLAGGICGAGLQMSVTKPNFASGM